MLGNKLETVNTKMEEVHDVVVEEKVARRDSSRNLLPHSVPDALTRLRTGASTGEPSVDLQNEELTIL